MDLIPESTQNPISVFHGSSRHRFHVHAEANHPPSVGFPGHLHPLVVNPTAAALSSSEPAALPKVGQTRCYWALLTTSLQFIVLDPVLRDHLQDQASRLLGCALLDFVHPDERESAQRDLGSVLEERTLHGSITRVRYCRLSRVRRLLGWSDSSLPYPPTFPAELIAVDGDYMAVYLVMNCVADDLVLCFIHAVVDIAPQADNDEFHKTGWSNWCSTYGFDNEQAHALYQRLCETVMPLPKRLELGCDSSLRVLQILRNQPARPLVLSWPPDSALFQSGHIVPIATSLAQLAQHIQIGYSVGNANDNDARTSCTRRYKSVQPLRLPTTGGEITVQVESIFIPHGMIIFACHKVNMDTGSTQSVTHTHSDGQSYQNTGTDPGNATHPAYDNLSLTTSQQDLNSKNYVQRWIDGQSQVQLRQENAAWDRRDMGKILQDPWYREFRSAEHSLPTDSRVQTSLAASAATRSDGAIAKTLSVVLSTTHVASVSDKGCGGPSCDLERPSSLRKDRPSWERSSGSGSGSGRVQGNPPAGVAKCAHCQITHSPEWRKGPSGKKDLCNACGLRFSRSRAKQEGIISRKRRNREKDATANEHPYLQADFAPVPNTSEIQDSADEGRNMESFSTRISDAPTKSEGTRFNGIPFPQSFDRPTASLSLDCVTTGLRFVETARDVRMSYLS